MSTVRTVGKTPARGARGGILQHFFWEMPTASACIALAAQLAVAGPVRPAAPETAQPTVTVIGPACPADSLMSPSSSPTAATAAGVDQAQSDSSLAENLADQLLLDVIPTPAAASSSIPSVQAFAAATGGIPRALVLDPPQDEETGKRAEPTMIPLPPAGWTGIFSLAGLGAVSLLCRIRRIVR